MRTARSSPRLLHSYTIQSRRLQSYMPLPAPSMRFHEIFCFTQPKPASLTTPMSRLATSGRHHRKACIPYSGEFIRSGFGAGVGGQGVAGGVEVGTAVAGASVAEGNAVGGIGV